MAAAALCYTGCSSSSDPDSPPGKTADSTAFAGIWANASYDNKNGQPAAKLSIDSTGLSWVVYNYAADTAKLRTVPAVCEGLYAKDDTWTEFKISTTYFLLKINGTTLFLNYSPTSYDDAYATTTNNCTFAKATMISSLGGTTWENSAYNNNGDHDAKFVVSSDGSTWTAYDNVTTTTAYGTTTCSSAVAYAADSDWLQITVTGATYFSLIKIKGTAMNQNISTVSFDDAYGATTMKYTYTRK